MKLKFGEPRPRFTFLEARAMRPRRAGQILVSVGWPVAANISATFLLTVLDELWGCALRTRAFAWLVF